MTRIVVLVVLVVLVMLVAGSTSAIAAPHHVMVLPIDGDADPALRKQLGGVVAELAKSTGGTVTTGDTTFAETAAAVGCDPHALACADTVLATLGVDEIVYGSASGDSLVVVRVGKGQPHRDQTVATGGGADGVEPLLHPLFDLPVATPPPLPEPTTVVIKPMPPAPSDSLFATRESKLGYGFVAGGALVLVIGLALWASESSQQSQIDSAPTNSPDDIKKLLALEDRASSYAWEGNVAVVLGLAAAGVGTYYLIEDHQLRATVTPIDRGTGAAVVLGGRW